ncbi:MAG: hypothetical protein COA42_20870 [Alteromonadaceae bacterium]|nr:MAG: hypothetical protein COA42_20870 [Alteromonadaceae bacterium]
MCTISWFVSSNGYDVFFNRDEQKSRVRADVPSEMSIDGVKVLMPIDPQGGGTWFAANERGLSVALLNYYQGRLPKGPLISRGEIVKHCATLSVLNDIEGYVDSLSLTRYAPFSLLVFDALVVENCADGAVTMLRWTGRELQRLSQASPLISSAAMFEKVNELRKENYHTAFDDSCAESLSYDSRVKLHSDYHSGHQPSASAFSVCMHREDAHTVSFSHLAVSLENVSMRYADGAPCQTAEVHELHMLRC